MATTKFGETFVKTSGELPPIGSPAPVFELTANDLSQVSLLHFKGKKVILNIFPSVDTRVCAKSVQEFNQRAAAVQDTVILCISRDLPFAQSRFCSAAGIDRVVMLSEFRNRDFARQYGIELMQGPFEGLHARAVVVIDTEGIVRYSDLARSIGDEPDYDRTLGVLSEI